MNIQHRDNKIPRGIGRINKLVEKLILKNLNNNQDVGQLIELPSGM
jgi:hypothetical protein